jgi:hypothetical protein
MVKKRLKVLNILNKFVVLIFRLSDFLFEADESDTTTTTDEDDSKSTRSRTTNSRSTTTRRIVMRRPSLGNMAVTLDSSISSTQPPPTIQQANIDLVTQLRAYLDHTIKANNEAFEDIRRRLSGKLAYYAWEQYIDDDEDKTKTDYSWLVDSIAKDLVENKRSKILVLNGTSGIGKTHFIRQLDQCTMRQMPDGLDSSLKHIQSRLIYVHYCRSDNEMSYNAYEFIKNIVYKLLSKYDAYKRGYSHLVDKLLV